MEHQKLLYVQSVGLYNIQYRAYKDRDKHTVGLFTTNNFRHCNCLIYLEK
jgi:hypothetical protein